MLSMDVDSIVTAAEFDRRSPPSELVAGTWFVAAIAVCRGALATIVPALRSILNL